MHGWDGPDVGKHLSSNDSLVDHLRFAQKTPPHATHQITDVDMWVCVTGYVGM
jgi:hypothetical protein